jgi:hypothetical protein
MTGSPAANFLVCVILLISTQATAEAHFKQNKLNHTVEKSGLYEDPTCSRQVVSGTVVKREFSNDAITVTGFIFERVDGTRQLVNVDVPSGLNRVSQEIVDDGLQRLLRVGRVIHGRALQCGVSGRIFVLEQIE